MRTLQPVADGTIKKGSHQNDFNITMDARERDLNDQLREQAVDGIKTFEGLGQYTGYVIHNKQHSFDYKHRSSKKKQTVNNLIEKRFKKTSGYRSTVGSVGGANRIKLANIQNSYGIGLAQKITDIKRDESIEGHSDGRKGLIQHDKKKIPSARMRIRKDTQQDKEGYNSLQEEVDYKQLERKKLATAENAGRSRPKFM